MRPIAQMATAKASILSAHVNAGHNPSSATATPCFNSRAFNFDYFALFFFHYLSQP
jgi:hypothetical protein